MQLHDRMSGQRRALLWRDRHHGMRPDDDFPVPRRLGKPKQKAPKLRVIMVETRHSAIRIRIEKKDNASCDAGGTLRRDDRMPIGDEPCARIVGRKLRGKKWSPRNECVAAQVSQSRAGLFIWKRAPLQTCARDIELPAYTGNDILIPCVTFAIDHDIGSTFAQERLGPGGIKSKLRPRRRRKHLPEIGWWIRQHGHLVILKPERPLLCAITHLKHVFQPELCNSGAHKPHELRMMRKAQDGNLSGALWPRRRGYRSQRVLKRLPCGDYARKPERLPQQITPSRHGNHQGQRRPPSDQQDTSQCRQVGWRQNEARPSASVENPFECLAKQIVVER